MRMNLYLPAGRVLITALFIFSTFSSFGQLTKLPWDPDPDCNSIVTTGIAAVTCGTTFALPAEDRYTFGLIDLNGALPPSGRIDVTSTTDMYHHPSWHIDSIGNVFGITMDNLGNIYLTASSNYSSDFFTVQSVIRYGDIGGGAESVEAAGTVYKIDAITAEASVFSVLPQQAYAFVNTTCEGIQSVDRFTGPGLGNIAFHPDVEQFYVTNFEDGRIYRLDISGAILDSYDPFALDNGVAGVSDIEELAYGITVSPDGNDLFFGDVNNDFFALSPSIYSIPLQPDGSFPGTIDNSSNPTGATWDNYVGADVFHIQLSMEGFGDVGTVSDLEFSPSGNLLVGNRIGCNGSIHTSYSHGGRSQLIGESGGLYNVPLGVIYTSNGVFDDENCYGGISVFDNPNGTVEFVISSADLLDESGPHGLSTQEEGIFGSPFAPASPAGIVAYLQSVNEPFSDPKGMGGDIFVFKACILQACPTAIVATDLDICSSDLFDLEYSLTGGTPDDVVVTWTNSIGMVIDPDNVMIMHDGCEPGTFDFFVEAICLEDSTVVLTDTATVTVYTTDLSPFITVVEEPCFIDVIIDPACEDFLTIIGDIPIIEPGDVGTAIVQVFQNGAISCDTLTIELNYNCTCTIDDLEAVPQDCVDGMFMVELNFEHENTGNEFEVFDQDGTSLGVFNYADLPVMVGPFLGDASVTYTLTVEDLDIPDCTASIEVGPVNCQVNCNAGIESDVCDGDVLQLFENGGDAVAWLWSSDGAAVISDVNAQDPTASNVSNGEIFTVVVTTGGGLLDSCTVFAVVFDLPVCNATNSGPICEGEPLGLNEEGGDAVAWLWSSDGTAVIDDVNAQNPTATNVGFGELFTVEITDANGCVETCSTEAFVFLAPDCNAGGDTPVCSGDVVELFEDGGDAVSWTWSTNGSAVISDINSQSPSATGVANGEVFTVEISDANGCTSSCTVTITVNDLPVCEAVTGGPICEGGILELDEIGGEAVSWSWSTSGGATISDVNAQNPTAIDVADSDVFTVEITDANNCVSTCSVVAVVNKLPLCNAGNDGPICAGEPLGLFEDAGDASTWEWSTNGSAVIDDVNAQNPTATGVTDGEEFTVIVTDGNGCISSCSTTAAVFDDPVCNALNDGPICAGEILQLTENGGEATSWQWSSDGSAVISDVNAQSPMATNVSDGETFTVEITDANGCTSSCSTTVVVFDAPDVIATNNGPICEGDLLILKADVMSGSPPYSYSWTHSNGFTSANANVYIQMTTQDDAGTYTVEVTDASGCTASATTDVEINFNLTDPGSIAGDEYFCGPGFDPAPIVEVTPPSGATGPIEFFWMMLEEGSAYWEIISGADGPSYDPGPIYVTTTYSRCVRIDGCIMALESNMVTKTVGDEAIADPTGMTGICVDDLNVYSVTAQPGATYAWDFGPGATPQYANTPSVTVSWDSYGVRTITVTVTTATCTANNFLEVFVTTNTAYCEAMMGMSPEFSNGPELEDAQILVFPNPFEDRIQVRLGAPSELPGKVQVTNVQGAVLQVLPIAAGDHEFMLDLEDLPSGVYLLRIDLGEDRAYYERVIKR